MSDSEETTLLNGHPPSTTQTDVNSPKNSTAAFTFIFIAALVLGFTYWRESLPSDAYHAALSILEKAPVIDGHIDLPYLARIGFRNNITAIDMKKMMPMHVDIPRLRDGHVGGFFWSVYTPCEETGSDFVKPSNSARDTLEQIDIARLIIEKHSDVFQLATSVSDVQNAIMNGKIASLLGVEGAHQLSNSFGALRMYHALGVRYVTLTHVCNNAFADSAGAIGLTLESVHNGLSPLGRTLISELNRLGILVDLSHTSDATAAQALALSRAPVIWSHSSARAVWNVTRNVPDRILKKVGTEQGKTDAVVMVNFAPQYIATNGNATVQAVADHVEHIGRISGREHVGIGSDFDGISNTPRGLEDVSRYPQLFAELRSRGWTKAELVGLAGGNFIRVFKSAEKIGRKLREEGAGAAVEIYKKRKDM